MVTDNTILDMERCLDMAEMLNRSMSYHYDRERNKRQILNSGTLHGMMQWWEE